MDYKKLIPWQSEFDHRWACWASNHRGWAKMKRGNRKLAKKRLKRYVRKEINDGLQKDN